MRPFRPRSLLWGLVAGVVAGLSLAVPMTWADWRLNPSGIFRGADGTHWSIVVETASSWFFPVAIPVFVVAVALHYWLSGRQAYEP